MVRSINRKTVVQSLCLFFCWMLFFTKVCMCVLEVMMISLFFFSLSSVLWRVWQVPAHRPRIRCNYGGLCVATGSSLSLFLLSLLFFSLSIVSLSLSLTHISISLCLHLSLSPSCISPPLVWVAPLVLGCLPALCCWLWIVWLMHVLCIDSDVNSCFELWSALSQSCWIRRYINVTSYYYYLLFLVVRVADDSIIPAFWIAVGAFEFGEQVSPLTASQVDALLVSGSKVSVLVCLSVHLSSCPSVCLSVHLSVCLSVYLSSCLSVCLSVHLSSCLSACLSTCLPICLLVCPHVFLSACLSTCLPVSACLSTCLPVCLSVYLSSCLLVCPPVFLSVCLLVCPPVFLPVCLSTCLPVWQNIEFGEQVSHLDAA